MHETIGAESAIRPLPLQASRFDLRTQQPRDRIVRIQHCNERFSLNPMSEVTHDHPIGDGGAEKAKEEAEINYDRHHLKCLPLPRWTLRNICGVPKDGKHEL
ncbi:MAG: hypothetical protein Q9216_006453, partial [Gyalolechia sp. 2 TL-2023]